VLEVLVPPNAFVNFQEEADGLSKVWVLPVRGQAKLAFHILEALVALHLAIGALGVLGARSAFPWPVQATCTASVCGTDGFRGAGTVGCRSEDKNVEDEQEQHNTASNQAILVSDNIATAIFNPFPFAS